MEKLHKYDLNNLNLSQNIFRLMKSKRIRWADHVACMGDKIGVYRFLVGKYVGERPFGRPGIDGKIMLRWIFRKWDLGAWTGSSWLRIGTSDGH